MADLVLDEPNPLEDADGVLTRSGMEVMHRYARTWVGGQRDVELEKRYPSMAGPFYDVRVDPSLAREHALPFDGETDMPLVLEA